MFGAGGATNTQGGAAPEAGEQPNAEGVFADVFEEVSDTTSFVPATTLTDCCAFQLLRPEVQRHAPWWSWTGTVCGAGIGFIVANVPGLMVGAYAGNRLGAIRDAKGKSVAAVFAELGGGQKAEVSIVFRCTVTPTHVKLYSN